MKKTLRILSLLLIAAMLFAFAACGNTPDNGENESNENENNNDGNNENNNDDGNTEKEYAKLNVGVLKGPTGVGAVGIADKANAKKNGSTDANAITKGNYDIEFYETANVAALQTNVINGSVDIAAVPINAASVLYNKTNGAVQIIAVNALGVLSIVGTGEYDSITDLSGTTIHTINQGATPEFILRYVLAENGIADSVNVQFYSTPNEAVAKALTDGGVAMIPEPAVTSVQKQNANVKVLFNMTEEWDKVSDTKLVQGVLVARKEVIKNHPEEIALFLKEYSASVEFVNNNPTEAATSIVNYGIVAAAPIAQQAIPGCNVVCYNGTTMQNDVSAMLEILFNAAPNSVGGKLPDSAIYYVIEEN